MKHIFIPAVSAFLYCTSFCQAGSLDKTFGNNGKIVTSFDGAVTLYSIALQTDGKIVAAGYRDTGTLSNPNWDIILVRYNSIGTLDNSFGNKGKVITDIREFDVARSVAVQADGKIVVAGYTETGFYPDLYIDIALVRYNANGSIDSSFGNKGMVITNINQYDHCYAMAIQNNGKILLTGSTEDKSQDIVVLRFNENGTPDNKFGNNGAVITGYRSGGIFYEDEGDAIALQTDGKILVAGFTYDGISNTANTALLRFNINGTADSAFGDNGKTQSDTHFTPYGNAIGVEPDGRIVLAGDGRNDDYNSYAQLAWYKPNGKIDKTVDVDNYYSGRGSVLHSIAVQPDGKIVSAGNAEGITAAAVRYTSSGKRDSTFGKNGLAGYFNEQLSPYGYGNFPIALQPDGKIVTAFSYKHYFSLARLLGDNSTAITDATAGTVNNIKRNYSLISLYPNPVTDNLFIDGLNTGPVAEVTITTISGSIVKTEKTGNKNAVYVSTLKAGSYIATIKQNNKTVSIKFIKQ